MSNTAISPEEAKKNLEQDTNICLIDVREPEEFLQGHIKNAVNLPVAKIAHNIDTVAADYDTPIYTYCHSGPRSSRAVMVLKQMGYTNVRNLGGIMAWPYGIVFGEGKK